MIMDEKIVKLQELIDQHVEKGHVIDDMSK